MEGEIFSKKRKENTFGQASSPLFRSKIQRAHLEANTQTLRLSILDPELQYTPSLTKRWQDSIPGAELTRPQTVQTTKDKITQYDREHEFKAYESYLGYATKKKKQVVKPSNKFRFSFDHNPEDDTSRDPNPLYQNPTEAQLLFGRGFLAGIDRSDQSMLATQKIKQLRSEPCVCKTGNASGIRRETHGSEKKAEEMTERDWRIFQEDNNISYKNSARIPHPMRSWDEGGLSPELLQAVTNAGYKKPSPIQMAVVPIGLQPRDVIGISETGSGKTVAFVLPMLSYIAKLQHMIVENAADGPHALVMAPTRELAQQIQRETMKLAGNNSLIRVVCLVGGEDIGMQYSQLAQGCQVVVGTPGRILDCLENRFVVLNQCNYVVLDEADRMLDDTFESQVIKVLDAMPSTNLKRGNKDVAMDSEIVYRTTSMFSATMLPWVERLARKYLRNPVIVKIGTVGRPSDHIVQRVIMTRETEKYDRLCHILHEMEGNKTRSIIFVNEKRTAINLSKRLQDNKSGDVVTTIHGDMTQAERFLNMDKFRMGRFSCLVATDVVGRGIDIPEVAHVVNYDMAGSIEKYTHRIGRTGRAGKTGVATTFLTLQDTPVFHDLKLLLVQCNAVVPSELQWHKASKLKPRLRI